MTPQELMDIDGAGNAAKQCIKDGQWDELAGLPEIEFRVHVEYQEIVCADDFVNVKARHADEAEEVAIEQIEDDIDVVNFSASVLSVEEQS